MIRPLQSDLRHLLSGRGADGRPGGAAGDRRAGMVASSPAIGVVTRFWGTFLILSFNLVMLNALMGWESRWYKPAWGTLSTFFFARWPGCSRPGSSSRPSRCISRPC